MRREHPFGSMSFLLLVVLAVWLFMGLGTESAQHRLSRAEFESLVSGGDVVQVVIRQNRETPTGEALLVF